jgi:hypothetical protein
MTVTKLSEVLAKPSEGFFRQAARTGNSDRSDGPNYKNGFGLLTKPLLSRIADESQPIVSAWINAGDLVGTLSLTFASFKAAHIVPQGKQVQVELEGIQVAKSPVMVQELL